MVVVEHEMDVVAGADWVIDLGPGGGDAGGRIVAAGPPAEVARVGGEPDGALPGGAAGREGLTTAGRSGQPAPGRTRPHS